MALHNPLLTAESLAESEVPQLIYEGSQVSQLSDVLVEEICLALLVAPDAIPGSAIIDGTCALLPRVAWLGDALPILAAPAQDMFWGANVFAFAAGPDKPLPAVLDDLAAFHAALPADPAVRRMTISVRIHVPGRDWGLTQADVARLLRQQGAVPWDMKLVLPAERVELDCFDLVEELRAVARDRGLPAVAVRVDDARRHTDFAALWFIALRCEAVLRKEDRARWAAEAAEGGMEVDTPVAEEEVVEKPVASSSKGKKSQSTVGGRRSKGGKGRRGR